MRTAAAVVHSLVYMNRRRLHILHRPAVGATRYPPLLFVHGGYVTAGCWSEYFLPYFSERGFDCHAVDLSGHGASEGRERLDSFGLQDYANDIAQAVRSIGRSPILVGHSMGTVVIERYLEHESAQAAVFMAPVPATGTLAATAKLALTEPAFFSETTRASRGEYSPQTLRIMREVYYSPDMKPEDLLRFQTQFQAESQRAITEMALLALRFPRRRPSLPVLAVGGELDAVFAPTLLKFTAARWSGEVAVIPRAGHTIMLDVHWEAAAERICAWLEQQDWGSSTTA